MSKKKTNLKFTLYIFNIVAGMININLKMK
jgi:hypothetical protein